MKKYQFIFEATTSEITVRFLIITEDFASAKQEAKKVAGIEFIDYNLISCKEMTPYTADENKNEE